MADPPFAPMQHQRSRHHDSFCACPSFEPTAMPQARSQAHRLTDHGGLPPRCWAMRGRERARGEISCQITQAGRSFGPSSTAQKGFPLMTNGLQRRSCRAKEDQISEPGNRREEPCLPFA
jgi:hypothetical protein